MPMLRLSTRTDDRAHDFDTATAPEDAHFGADDIGWQALAPALSCSILATLIVAARWYSRCRLARCVGTDDYVILLSLLLSWPLTTTIALAVPSGAGVYHSANEATHIAQLIIAANALWILIVNITKASLLAQYLRIFSSPLTRALSWTLLSSLAPVVGYAIFAGIFLCDPVAKLWDPSLIGTCRSAEIYWLSVAGLDITLDLLVLLLPLPSILRLRLPTRQKTTLIALFTLGFLVCLVAAARMVSVYITAHRGEYVESGVWAVIWNAVEANTGIICACFLSLKPLAQKWWPGWFVEREGEVPRHAMRIREVDTSGARWSRMRLPVAPSNLAQRGGSDAVTMTPSSAFSREGLKRWSSARAWRTSEGEKGASEAEDAGAVRVENEAGIVQAEDGARVRQRDRGEEENVTIWEMLERPEQAAVRGDGCCN